MRRGRWTARRLRSPALHSYECAPIARATADSTLHALAGRRQPSTILQVSLLRLAPAVCLLLLCAIGTGCAAHHLSRGADLYEGGFYIEAAEVFERTEPRLKKCSVSERARYGLYRGATLLALGDLRRAEQWLQYSRRIVDSDTAALSRDDRSLLNQTWRTLGEKPPAIDLAEIEDAAIARSRPVRAVAEGSTEANGSRN